VDEAEAVDALKYPVSGRRMDKRSVTHHVSGKSPTIPKFLKEYISDIRLFVLDELKQETEYAALFRPCTC
jgi:hypothetical protein